MELIIRIELDNPPFEDGRPSEVERILPSDPTRIPDPLRECNSLSLHDANGNHCGTARIESGRIPQPYNTTLAHGTAENAAYKLGWRQALEA